MYKFFIVLICLAALTMGGCAAVPMTTGVIQQDGSCASVAVTAKRIIMLQVGTQVYVTNNCADYLTLGGFGVVADNDCLPFNESTTVTMISDAFTGTTRSMSLVAKAWDRRGNYRGSVTTRYTVNTHTGSQRKDWTVDRLDSPPNGVGCQK